MRFTRRTGFTALAVAGTALLIGAGPAFADGGTPTPVPSTTATAPTPAPAPSEATPEPAPTVAPGSGEQVPVVPRGAADTGEGTTAASSPGDGTLIGGSVAVAFAAGGAGVYVLRRRRTTGA
ncbi:Tat pathway signal sequence domain protein [Streptomyces sp. ID05-39B]|uniref:sortase-dependent protein n=1 Tax=Streptomyces sp. ID05-39B TaxID=3028664 RepID=UPI0029A8E1B0|nr:sortase-dependent protein [Streptomyces sp. ID05-39B]MDX3531541.1 Tat pathway signal sequence domain protein [Streptomyces sp. ID05-39B]